MKNLMGSLRSKNRVAFNGFMEVADLGHPALSSDGLVFARYFHGSMYVYIYNIYI